MSEIIYPNFVGDLAELVGKPTVANDAFYGCLAINKKLNSFILISNSIKPKDDLAIPLSPGYYFELVTEDHPTLGKDLDYVEEICSNIDWSLLSSDWEYSSMNVSKLFVKCNMCKHFSLLNLYCNLTNKRKDPGSGCYCGEL
jgi:hypothetical protein